jgi:hypothetical protein
MSDIVGVIIIMGLVSVCVGLHRVEKAVQRSNELRHRDWQMNVGRQQRHD